MVEVSIITPSFNQGQFIEETILSVLNQTYKNIQYIVVDGGSTDQTLSVLQKYRDRIDIIISEKDNGQSDAINKGFKLSKGTLVGWINSDDTLYPDCVENIVALYKQNPDGSIFYGSLLDQINKDSKSTGLKKYHIPNKTHLLNTNYDVVQPGSFYSRKTLTRINFLDASIHYCMDLDLWIRLLEYGNIYSYKKKPIATIRKWEGTKTSTGENIFLKEIKKIILAHGAKEFSRNVMYINYCILKNKIKKIGYREPRTIQASN